MDSTNIVSYYAQLVGALSGREALLHALSNIDVPLVFNHGRYGRNSTSIQRIQQVLCGGKSSGMVHILLVPTYTFTRLGLHIMFLTRSQQLFDSRGALASRRPEIVFQMLQEVRRICQLWSGRRLD